jgi:hypothetical protein
MVELKHEPYMPVAKRDQVGVGEISEPRARDADLSPIRAVETAEDMKKGTFADAGGANDRDHLATHHLQGQVAQDMQMLRPDRVGLVKRTDGNKRHGPVTVGALTCSTPRQERDGQSQADVSNPGEAASPPRAHYS